MLIVCQDQTPDATFPNEGASHCFPFWGILISHFIMLLKLKMSSAGLAFGHRPQLGTTFNSTSAGTVEEGWGTTSFYQAPVEQRLHGYEDVIPRCHFCSLLWSYSHVHLLVIAPGLPLTQTGMCEEHVLTPFTIASKEVVPPFRLNS